MSIFTCEICGYVYDERNEGAAWTALPADWKCALCGAPKECFREEQREDTSKSQDALSIQDGFEKQEDPLEEQMMLIHEMAIKGTSRSEAMRTKKAVPGFDDILLLGAQLARFPLADKAEITSVTIIGKHARKPMELALPVYVSHMSYGALSREMKIALAKGTAAVQTAQCSGEGGILPEEMDNSHRYIFEYVPNKYSVTAENLKRADAIEIKIGQGSKPGMGGHLPGEKVTEEIARIRSKPLGEDVISPSRFEEIKTKDDLKNLVDWLREQSEGRPIGIKLAAGHLEADLAWIDYANPDFITLDGRGGATGSSPTYLKDNTTVPTIYALARARAYMDAHEMKQDLVITGGFRTSGDIIKAIAMGADAVAVASAAMMAAGCQQYRVCHMGNCPMGIATQDPELRKRFDIERSAKRIANFFSALKRELESFARVSGHQNLHDISVEDLCTTSDEIANHTSIPHA